jgi:hypothetical protein
MEAKALDGLCRSSFLEMSCVGTRVPAQSPFHKQLIEKRKDGRLCQSVGGKKEKNFQSFTMICRKPHMASSICLRATIFQNHEGTLWTHCIIGWN